MIGDRKVVHLGRLEHRRLGAPRDPRELQHVGRRELVARLDLALLLLVVRLLQVVHVAFVRQNAHKDDERLSSCFKGARPIDLPRVPIVEKTACGTCAAGGRYASK